MLSALECQRNRLKNLLYRRIDSDFEDDSPVAILNSVRKEEENGADIQYLYGEKFERVYKMVIEMKRTIENSDSPYEDPVVHSTLEKYSYYISPSGRHIYGAGPQFND